MKVSRFAVFSSALSSHLLGNVGRYFNITRRERLNSALHLRLKKRSFEICVGCFHEKLLFSDLRLRLLLTKAQYISVITSKVRIQRSTPDIAKGDFNKIEGGPFEDKKKISKRKSHSADTN